MVVLGVFLITYNSWLVIKLTPLLSFLFFWGGEHAHSRVPLFILFSTLKVYAELELSQLRHSLVFYKNNLTWPMAKLLNFLGLHV